LPHIVVAAKEVVVVVVVVLVVVVVAIVGVAVVAVVIVVLVVAEEQEQIAAGLYISAKSDLPCGMVSLRQLSYLYELLSTYCALLWSNLHQV